MLYDFEAKIDADGGHVGVSKKIIAEAAEEWAFADALVADDDYFELVLLSFNHVYIIR